MKGSLLKSRVFSVLLVFVLLLSACSPASNVAPDSMPVESTSESFDSTSLLGQQAYNYLNEIATLGARIAGTDAEKKAADWLDTTLTEMGYEVLRTPFTYEDNGSKTSENIIVQKQGTDDTTVIIGAHYDSVDVGSGIDDNGSGVAVVLEAAKYFKDIQTPHTLKFVFFGAEEVDLLGSTYFAEAMTDEEVSQTALMINFDSIVAGDFAYVYGNANELGWLREFTLEKATSLGLELITQEGLNEDFPAGTTGDWSDHAPFKDRGISILYFESTNWLLGALDGYTQVEEALGENGEIWHTEFDTMLYLEETFPGRVKDKLTLFSTILRALLEDTLTATN
jgi:Zn-dependent M28 family amino/carboxypeptidase